MTRNLWAVADLHAATPKNFELIKKLAPPNPEDWIIVAGDVAERPEKILEVLSLLKQRYAEVIWAPGNHELFSTSSSEYQGKEKYEYLVQQCRTMGIHTPEDAYLQFAGLTIAPLFTLYDYSFRPDHLSAVQALDDARNNQRVLLDDVTIAPFVDIQAWCWERLTYSVRRLSALTGPTILVNHWPLVAEPLQALVIPEIGLWSGSVHTRNWPQRFRAQQVIYGHLHLPGSTIVNGIAHHEVSLGYPYQWEENLADRQWPHLVVSDAQ